MSDTRHITEESHFTEESYYSFAEEHDGSTSINLTKHNGDVHLTVTTNLFDFGVSSKASVVLSEDEVYDILDWLNLHLTNQRMEKRSTK